VAKNSSSDLVTSMMSSLQQHQI